MASKTYKTGELEKAQVTLNKVVETQEKVRMSLVETLKAEPKVEVVGAPMYRAWFGNQMCISINGFPIYVPLDGRRYSIPESYAVIFNTRIRSVNEDINLERMRSDVQRNAESYPGELDLVKPV